jgi:hypothetical protein
MAPPTIYIILLVVKYAWFTTVYNEAATCSNIPSGACSKKCDVIKK